MRGNNCTGYRIRPPLNKMGDKRPVLTNNCGTEPVLANMASIGLNVLPETNIS